ncbi:MAG: protease pro-enzyme activation domain-containing protein, partial [Candidatus Sulfotelmatobacter sp.]
MRSWKFLLPLFASTLCLAAQPDRITSPISSGRTVALARSVHPKAQPQYDRGAVEPSFALSYVTLVVAPSPSQQIALDQLLAQQQDRSSPNYHKWLTPEQYAERFGLSQNDVNKISAWLKAQGFTVLSVPRGRNAVIFSGTAAQVKSAFKTEIHRYDVNGEKHIANSSAVYIPAALNGVVTGIRGLADFRPKPMYVRPRRGSKAAGPHPSYTATISGE